MNENQFRQVLDTLKDHEARLARLESTTDVPSVMNRGNKVRTLRELVKGKKFKNGSEKIAAIVGYNEKIIGTLIHQDALKKEWEEAKIDGVYKTNLRDDAIGTYIRVKSSGVCDLTQTGEEFFEGFTHQ